MVSHLEMFRCSLLAHVHYRLKHQCLGGNLSLIFVSISEAGPGPRPKRTQVGPRVGQGRIKAQRGTFGMERNATIKPEKFERNR